MKTLPDGGDGPERRATAGQRKPYNFIKEAERWKPAEFEEGGIFTSGPAAVLRGHERKWKQEWGAGAARRPFGEATQQLLQMESSLDPTTADDVQRAARAFWATTCGGPGRFHARYVRLLSSEGQRRPPA